MTGKAAGAYSRRLTELDAWLKQPDNRVALTAASKVHKVRLTDAAAVLRVLVSKTNTHSGVVAATLDQIADATLMPAYTVRRALKALDTAGVLVTVYKGRKGADGKGKAAGRRVLFLAGDNSDQTATSVHSDSYQRALNALPACTQVHTTTVDSTTEYIITPENFSAEPATDKGKGKPAQTDMRWSDEVVSQVVSNLAARTPNPRNPAGLRISYKLKARTAAVQVLDQYGIGVTKMMPSDYDWSSLVMVIGSMVQGEPIGKTTSDALQTAANNALTS